MIDQFFRFIRDSDAEELTLNLIYLNRNLLSINLYPKVKIHIKHYFTEMEGNTSEETNFLITMFSTNISLSTDFDVTPTGNFSNIPIHTQIQIFVTCFGIAGNSIIMWITSNLVNKSGRYNLLLLLLAIVDTVYLCSLCVQEEGIFGKIGFEGTLINCLIIKFVAHLFGILSSWLVSVICFERFVCIQWPIYSHMSGKKLLIVILIVLLIFSAGMSSAVFPSSSVIKNNNSSQCILRLSSDTTVDITIFWLFIILHSIVPTIIVIIFNILIIKALITQNKRFKRGTTNSSGEMKKAQSITRMLIMVSFLFAACRLPVFFNIIVDTVVKHIFKFDIFKNYGYISGIGHIIAMVDHAWNLFVYLLSSSVFRAQPLNQLSCRRRIE